MKLLLQIKVFMDIITPSVSADSEGGLNWIVKALIIAVVIGLVVGFIRAMALKSQLTSVYKKDSAADYTRDKSFKVDTKKDTFLYSKTEKKEKSGTQSKS